MAACCAPVPSAFSATPLQRLSACGPACCGQRLAQARTNLTGRRYKLSISCEGLVSRAVANINHQYLVRALFIRPTGVVTFIGPAGVVICLLSCPGLDFTLLIVAGDVGTSNSGH